MGKKLERFGEVGIGDEANAFGLDFVEKTESEFGFDYRKNHLL